MHIPRIYIDTVLEINNKIRLPLTASKHIIQVLRLKPGDKFIVFNGKGSEYLAILQDANKKNAQILLTNCSTPHVESSLHINIVQGVARGEKMDYIVQKTTELGVQTITPVVTEYSNVHFSKEHSEKRIQHWQNIAINAAEQSGRCYIPQIMPLENLSTWITRNKSGLTIILDPHKSSNTLVSLAKKIQNLKNIPKEDSTSEVTVTDSNSLDFKEGYTSCSSSGRIHHSNSDSDKINPLDNDESSLKCVLDIYSSSERGKQQRGKSKCEEYIINLLVGPEGGFSPQEIELANENNCQFIKLGPRILRTETSALVATSILQALLGDLSS